jgi:hypothetical protein
MRKKIFAIAAIAAMVGTAQSASAQDVPWLYKSQGVIEKQDFDSVKVSTTGAATLQLYKGGVVVVSIPVTGVDSLVFNLTPVASTVTTAAATDVTTTTATLGGTVVSVGVPSYTEKGVVYGTAADPTVGSGTKVAATGTGIGAFSVSVTGLTSGTAYHVRAYTINGEANVATYGTDVTFTTTTAIAAGSYFYLKATDGGETYILTNTVQHVTFDGTQLTVTKKDGSTVVKEYASLQYFSLVVVP